MMYGARWKYAIMDRNCFLLWDFEILDRGDRLHGRLCIEATTRHQFRSPNPEMLKRRNCFFPLRRH